MTTQTQLLIVVVAALLGFAVLAMCITHLPVYLGKLVGKLIAKNPVALYRGAFFVFVGAVGLTFLIDAQIFFGAIKFVFQALATLFGLFVLISFFRPRANSCCCERELEEYVNEQETITRDLHWNWDTRTDQN